VTITKWTHDEIRILTENYDNISPDKMLELLPNRNQHAIQHKACRLKIKRRGVYIKSYKPNSKISLDWLISNYIENEFSMQRCGDLLQLSPTTILKAIHYYGIVPRKETEKANTKARELIACGDWPLLHRDNHGDNNNAKRPEVREKIRLSKLGSKNAMFGVTGKSHPMYGRCGPDAPNWRGGNSFEPYCFKFNDAFKKHIKDKFEGRCYLCPDNSPKGKLHVHHIDYNKNSICNGKEWAFVPLCIKHHAKTNFNRWYWFNLLIHYWAVNPEINFNF